MIEHRVIYTRIVRWEPEQTADEYLRELAEEGLNRAYVSEHSATVRFSQFADDWVYPGGAVALVAGNRIVLSEPRDVEDFVWGER